MIHKNFHLKCIKFRRKRPTIGFFFLQFLVIMTKMKLYTGCTLTFTRNTPISSYIVYRKKRCFAEKGEGRGNAKTIFGHQPNSLYFCLIINIYEFIPLLFLIYFLSDFMCFSGDWNCWQSRRISLHIFSYFIANISRVSVLQQIAIEQKKTHIF